MWLQHLFHYSLNGYLLVSLAPGFRSFLLLLFFFLFICAYNVWVISPPPLLSSNKSSPNYPLEGWGDGAGLVEVNPACMRSSIALQHHQNQTARVGETHSPLLGPSVQGQPYTRTLQCRASPIHAPFSAGPALYTHPSVQGQPYTRTHTCPQAWLPSRSL
jgi:hypothetical protein